MTATTANNLAAQSHVTPGWFERTFSSGWKLALALLLITLLVRVCQSAFNRDPLSACKRDPLAVAGIG